VLGSRRWYAATGRYATVSPTSTAFCHHRPNTCDGRSGAGGAAVEQATAMAPANRRPCVKRLTAPPLPAACKPGVRGARPFAPGVTAACAVGDLARRFERLAIWRIQSRRGGMPVNARAIPPPHLGCGTPARPPAAYTALHPHSNLAHSHFPSLCTRLAAARVPCCQRVPIGRVPDTGARQHGCHVCTGAFELCRAILVRLTLSAQAI
jgi:hypothetical protein